MTTLDARAQALLDDFAKQPGAKPGMVDDMRAAMQTSPVLREELAATLASDPSAVRAIRLAPAGTNAGGFYDATTGTIHILDANFDRGARKDPERVDLITGVLPMNWATHSVVRPWLMPASSSTTRFPKPCVRCKHHSSI